MKKLFYGLAISAIMMTNFGTINVSAATSCKPNQEELTSYYLFTYLEGKNWIHSEIDRTNGNWPRYNQTMKTNNLHGREIIDKGPIAVIDGKGNSNSDDINPSATPWTLTDFWRNYITAINNATDNVYLDGNKEYVLHTNWKTCSDKECTSPSEEGKNYDDEAFKGYKFKGATDDLVTKGSALPETIITPEAELNSSAGNLVWKISRIFTNAEKVDGIKFGNPAAFPQRDEYRIYAPAVFYVKSCVDKPTTSINITYEPNAKNDDKNVKNMPADQTFNGGDGTCENIATEVPVREGFKFLGWSTRSDDTKPEAKYNGTGAEYCGTTDLTLYAIWEEETNPEVNPDTPVTPEKTEFTISYDANGGSDAPKSQTGTNDSCLTISKVKPKQEGHKFLGWSTDPEAAEADKKYDPESEYCGPESVKLYAVWQANTGVNAHGIAFMVAGLMSIVALIVAKKKDLFKQI